MRLLKLLLFVLLVGVVIANCSNERVGCNGKIIVQNPIPDTTLYVNGEEYERDISEPPVVFHHTENERIRIEAMAEDLDVVAVGTGIDASNNRHIIKITPRELGSTVVTVTAKDDCPDGGITTSFNVTVRDTTQ